jgi:hypothetical protein
MKLVPNVVTRQIAHSTLLAQKNSPGVLFGVGVVGMIGTTVLACRATLKLEEVLDESAGKISQAKNLDHPDYSEMDRKKDLSVIKVQTGVKIVKLYTPAIIVGGISIAALTQSHNILNRRNAALTAAYAALEKGFDEYRQRVIERYGEEQDQHFRYGTQQVEIEENGKKKVVTRVSQNDPSIYARFFDQGSPSWSKEPEYNLIFLKCQQNYANDLLRARGHVFLNEVYDMLGIPRSKAGAVVGWLLTPDGQTDNYINFGVFDDKSEAARDFVNGFEGAILLDFNVDGVIYDRIDMSREGEPLKWQLNR